MYISDPEALDFTEPKMVKDDSKTLTRTYAKAADKLS